MGVNYLSLQAYRIAKRFFLANTNALLKATQDQINIQNSNLKNTAPWFIGSTIASLGSSWLTYKLITYQKQVHAASEIVRFLKSELAIVSSN